MAFFATIYDPKFQFKNRVTTSNSNRLRPNMSLDEVRNLYDSGYTGRAKLRKMGIGVALDGKAWDRNGAYIGDISYEQKKGE